MKSSNSIVMLIFFALATTLFVFMAMRPAVDGTAMNLGVPLNSKMAVTKTITETDSSSSESTTTEIISTETTETVTPAASTEETPTAETKEDTPSEEAKTESTTTN